MKKWTLLFAMLFSLASWGQTASRYSSIADTVNNTTTVLPNAVQIVANPAVSVFTYPGPTVNCGISACTKATTYTDQTASVACGSSAQLVLDISNACSAIGDSLGNFAFWVLPGKYQYCVGSSSTPTLCFNITVTPDVNGVSTFTGNNTFSGNNIFSGVNSFTGSLFQSSATNPAGSGLIRLATGDQFCWRNAGNTADVCITKNGSDQISIPNLVFNPGTLTLSNNGVFTNTQGNQYLQSLLNSCSSASEYFTVQNSNNTTDALSGCVAVPLSATVHQQNGIAGYVNTLATGGSGGAVAGYFQARVLSGSANGPSIWGINPIVQDVVGPTGEQMMDAEMDMNVVGSPARAWGMLFTGNTTGTMPAGAGNAATIDIRAPGYASCTNNCTTAKQWVAGLNIEDSAASGAAINIGATSSASSTNSMPLTLNARDSGGTLRPVTLTAIFNGSVGATLGINNAIQKLNIQDKGQCTMAAGTCSAQTLNNTYTGAPICIVTWTGTGSLAGSIKVASSTTTVTPSSSNGADTAIVNWICIGS